MSKSAKARYGTQCKVWKDTVYASRSQARARAKRKQRDAQRQRARDTVGLRQEIKDGG